MAPSMPPIPLMPAAGSALSNATMPCSVNATVPALIYPYITKGIYHNNTSGSRTVTSCHDIEVKGSVNASESGSSCHGLMLGSPGWTYYEAKVCHPHSVSLEEADQLVLDRYYHSMYKANNSTSTSLVRRGTAVAPADIAQLAIASHNKVRAKHGAPPLRWNRDLAHYAQTVADFCRIAHNNAIGAETGSYGQSIASWGTTGIEHRSIDQLVVDGVEVQWYAGEIAKYPGYGQAQPPMEHFHEWGHFTQTLWAATSEVGCGIQWCPAETHPFPYPGMGAHLMFCNYRTPGNVAYKYADNVKSPVA